MAMEINILPLAIEAIGYKSRIHEDIDKLYKKKKYTFYEHAVNSKYYYHRFIRDGDIYREEYGRKALGIILYISENEDEEIENEFYKAVYKGWPQVYSYLASNKKVSISDFIYKQGNRYTNDDEMNTDLFILYWLAQMLGKEIDREDHMLGKIEYFFYERLRLADNDSEKYGHKTMSNEFLKDIKKLKSRVYEKYGTINHYDAIFHNYRKDFVRDVGTSIEFIIDTEDLNLSTLFNNISIKEKDIEEILGTYYLIFKNKNADEAARHLVWGYVLKGLLKAYNQVKEHYFRNNRETMFVEMKNQENKINTLEEKNKRLEFQVKNLKTELESIRSQEQDKYIKRTRELENTINQLRDELATEREKDKELIALREFFFSQDQEADIELDSEMPDFHKFKGAIFGGSPNWRHKMQQQLPYWEFINTENFDVKILENLDAVFFMTQYLNHSIYYKVMNEVKTIKNLPIGYINSLNEERALKEIADTLNKKLVNY